MELIKSLNPWCIFGWVGGWLKIISSRYEDAWRISIVLANTTINNEAYNTKWLFIVRDCQNLLFEAALKPCFCVFTHFVPTEESREGKKNNKSDRSALSRVKTEDFSIWTALRYQISCQRVIPADYVIKS